MTEQVPSKDVSTVERFECTTETDGYAGGHGIMEADAHGNWVCFEDYERLQRELSDERAIVDRIWKQLGIETYEQAGGKSIYEIIAERTAHEPSADQPVAWVIPGDDNAYANGALDARISQEGEFTRPLYARPAPPPALTPIGTTTFTAAIRPDGELARYRESGGDPIIIAEPGPYFAFNHQGARIVRVMVVEAPSETKEANDAG